MVREKTKGLNTGSSDEQIKKSLHNLLPSKEGYIDLVKKLGALTIIKGTENPWVMDYISSEEKKRVEGDN